MDYPWYKLIDKDEMLQQGDFVQNCPIIIPPMKLEENGEIKEVEVRLIDSIILSQSCDLLNGKAQIVLVCPYKPLSIFFDELPTDQQSKRARKRRKEDLKKGHLTSYHLLNKIDTSSHQTDFLVVDFANVYGVQYSFLTDYITKQPYRVRLLPPYREHLSQAFARYFMRVGLPQDIDI